MHACTGTNEECKGLAEPEAQARLDKEAHERAAALGSAVSMSAALVSMQDDDEDTVHDPFMTGRDDHRLGSGDHLRNLQPHLDKAAFPELFRRVPLEQFPTLCDVREEACSVRAAGLTFVVW